MPDSAQKQGNIVETSNKTASSDQKSSPIPSISLPKGGGAIRGIGEKFAANPVTGTGSLSVPIFTSPGRSGFGPQLSLSYDSGSGNGPFGFGWNLSIPSITRKTDKGLPKYQDAIESDVFVLSGAEDLVPVFKKKPDGNWEYDSKGDPKIDEDERDGYKIRRYRPRIEGLFARIERWTSKSGDVHWRLISKDNIITVYGRDDESRIFDPGDHSRIFSWLICESYDDKGNAIVYEYKKEDSSKVDISEVHEKNRNDLTRQANSYLKHIRYGNHTPRQTDEDLSQRKDWLFEVVFDYGEHDLEHPTPQDATPLGIPKEAPLWNVRQDAFSAYKAGFEVRTYRLCQRVLMFHHFPDEFGINDYLVRSTEFNYNESPVASFITKITQLGFVRKSDGTYLNKSLPPLEFGYSQATIQDKISQINAESLENLPQGLDGMSYRWVDLDGEGLSGILTEQADGWFYKPNRGGGDFGPLQLLSEKPSLAALNAGRQQLMDLAGDGQIELVEFGDPLSGFYERTQDRHWERFTNFASLPNINWSDPNLRFLDLTGDGHADILITEDNVFTWYPSLAEQGFGMSEKVSIPFDEEKGPKLIFADGTQSIYLGDMSGGGLTDIVRIRNGEVCYWPNLGYGRFGAKVTMDNSPWFDAPDIFDQKRIQLADIDGSGTIDIIYLGHEGVNIYFNQSGNSWSKVQTLTQFPHIDNLTSVTVVDLLGNGTACLLWSSPLPGDGSRQTLYIDLMGGQKPHLLISVKNNMGAETNVTYAPSTRFYIEDQKAGKPWVTRIPFPVHVVEWVEVKDWISHNYFVTHYAYHHGYFDGFEREFRGFGMVEQWDTEEFGTLSTSDTHPSATNIDAASHVPPVLTKTWFHNGAYIDGIRISRQFEDEYYSEFGIDTLEARAMLLEDTVLPDKIHLADGSHAPFFLSIEEVREAYRSLKGSILRQEIYALDGTEEVKRPYSVSERNYTIEILQPQRSNQHAVFFVHPRETVDFHYERKLFNNLADPRVSHSMTLAVDEFGNVLRSVAIGYGRRHDDLDPLLTDEDRTKQKRTHITYTENSYTNSVNQNDVYRTPLLCQTLTYELLKVAKPSLPLITNLFRFDEMESNVRSVSDGQNDIFYEQWKVDETTLSAASRRLVEHVRQLYLKDDLSGPLPLGTLDTQGLPYETYKLAFTSGLLEKNFIDSGKANASDLDDMLSTEGAYIDSKEYKKKLLFPSTDKDGQWWVPSGRSFLSPIPENPPDPIPHDPVFAKAHFYLPQAFYDPFGQFTRIRYDKYDLLMVETRDALGNIITVETIDQNKIIKVENDYRVMQARLVYDPNGNRSEVNFDALGMVAGMAVMGKAQEPDSKPKGDSLAGFMADITLSEIQAFIADPRDKAKNLLKDATTRIIYDVDRFSRCGQPPFAATLAREIHTRDLGGEDSPIQINFTYSDGFGREVQNKIQAESGDALEREIDEILPSGDIKPGKLVLENLEKGKPKKANTNHRWVGKGRTVYNNKGKPVKQYEPYFSSTHLYEEEPEMTDTGVTPVLFYDPVERVVATLHPNHTYEKVVFNPWRQESWDVNDTVLLPDPKTDQDVGDFFRRLPDTEYLPTWRTRRIGGALGDDEKSAAEKASIHRETPTVAYLDSLGRTFMTVAHNRFTRKEKFTTKIVEEKYTTRTELDIENNQHEVKDAKDRIVMRYDYDMLGTKIHQASMEAGERWVLNDVAGKPIRAWDSLGRAFRNEYDALRRPLRSYVMGADSKVPDKEILFERIKYGESHPSNTLLNLRTRVFMQFDGAGIVKNEKYDFKGNLLSATRRLARKYKEHLDWSPVEPLLVASPLNLPAIEYALSPLIESDFTGSTTYDALNRPITLTTPDKTIIRPKYNEANLLESVEANLKGVAKTTTFVVNINYDAKGRREFIQYGNGAKTQYSYDPDTFRLINLYTRRGEAFTEDCGGYTPAPRYFAPAEPLKGIPCGLQNIHYTYDPAGNITTLRDDAQQTIYFKGQVVKPDTEYTYDAIYRLIEADGREHEGQASQPSETTYDDRFRVGLEHPHDGKKMRNYFEFYEYDEVGNFLHFKHYANSAGWIRDYDFNDLSLIEEDKLLGKKNNRLTSTSIGIPTESYTYDAHGNMKTMPHLSEMVWDFKDQLQLVDKGGGCRAYYVYDAAGQRVRKVIEDNDKPLEERIYLGGFEVYHRYSGGKKLERKTLHIMDDKQRIALVDTRTEGEDESPPQVVRYQFGNHLGSASLELDDGAQIISYEEYYPYGSTSYQAGPNEVEVKRKRYRYTGKERDEETGLSYHGARYYAPWLGRWTSCDPLYFSDGINVYAYVNNNPIVLNDPSGTSGKTDNKVTEGSEDVTYTTDPKMAEAINKLTGYELNQAYDPGTSSYLPTGAPGGMFVALYDPLLSLHVPSLAGELGLKGGWKFGGVKFINDLDILGNYDMTTAYKTYFIQPEQRFYDKQGNLTVLPAEIYDLGVMLENNKSGELSFISDLLNVINYGPSLKGLLTRGSNAITRNIGGLRRSRFNILGQEEIASLQREFAEIGGDPKILSFNTGSQTSYDDLARIINVKGDVLPDPTGAQARSLMSSRATLAHELEHARSPLPQTRGFAPLRKAGDWNDEFRASYMAAKRIPNLNPQERAMLIRDAIDRAREAEVIINPNGFMLQTMFGF